MQGFQATSQSWGSLKPADLPPSKSVTSKEQAIGRLCYEAEEDLDPLELNALKRLLGVSHSQWQTYKAKFIAGSSPEEFI
jgi:transcriptional antiterminator